MSQVLFILYDFLMLAPSSLEPEQQSPKLTWAAFGLATALVVIALTDAMSTLWQVAADSAGHPTYVSNTAGNAKYKQRNGKSAAGAKTRDTGKA